MKNSLYKKISKCSWESRKFRSQKKRRQKMSKLQLKRETKEIKEAAE